MLPAYAEPSTVIEIDGASTLLPLTQKMAELFTAENPDVAINLNASGTISGFRQLCTGQTDINMASVPVRHSDLVTCVAHGVELIELLVASDALVVVVPRSNTFLRDISLEELNLLWAPEAEGAVTRWAQMNPAWPNESIQLHAPGTDSGTFAFFTDEINGEAGSSRTDYSSHINHQAIVAAVQETPWTLGYLSLPYFLQNLGVLRSLSVNGVDPTPENIKGGNYPYALSRPLYLYVNTAALDNPDIYAFVAFYLQTAPANDGLVVRDQGFVPLTREQYDTELSLIEYLYSRPAETE